MSGPGKPVAFRQPGRVSQKTPHKLPGSNIETADLGSASLCEFSVDSTDQYFSDGTYPRDLDPRSIYGNPFMGTEQEFDDFVQRQKQSERGSHFAREIDAEHT